MSKMLLKFLPFTQARKEQNEKRVWDESPKVEKPILRVDEKPKHWYETLLYAWQMSLVNISPFILPLVVVAAVGLPAEAGAIWVNRALFTMAIAIFIHTTIGTRFPLVQGPSSIMVASASSVGAASGAAAMWGAMFAGAISQTAIGLLGLPGLLRKLFPVAVSGVIITAIGFALGRLAVTWMIGDGSTTNWILAGLVIALIFFFQTVGRRIHPLLARGSIAAAVFLVGIVLASIMGVMNWNLVAEAPWFAVPRLFPEGGPGFGWTFVGVAFVGIMIGLVGSMAESLGDYSVIAAICDEEYKVKHMNRGVASEGLECLVAVMFGGLPMTSYSQGVGIVAQTRIASRFVVQMCAVIMGLYGLSPKVGAFMVAMPRSVIGAVFLIVSASILMAGFRLLSNIKPTTANISVVGFSLLAAVLIPPQVNSPALAEFRESLPALVRLVLTDTALLAVVSSIIIYQIINTIFRGINEEKEYDENERARKERIALQEAEAAGLAVAEVPVE
ncbi:MAG: purine/pyrimidine permease [Defluviitaleaceae bacterium]|nr:purine/pyrimidine permease [Defluviitaleaceae bacterium]